MGVFEATITKTNAYRMTANGRGVTRPRSSPAHMISFGKAFADVVPTIWMAWRRRTYGAGGKSKFWLLELSFNSNEFGRELLTKLSMFGKLEVHALKSCGGLNQ